MADDDTGNGSGENQGLMIPKARLAGETKLKRAAQQRVGELQTQVGDLEQQVATLTTRAETAGTLATEVTELKASIVASTAAWDEERGIYRSGITDPDAIDVARMFHSRLAEDGRPALGEWLKGFSEDASKAPRALQPYLTKAETAGDKAETTTTQTTTGGKPTRVVASGPEGTATQYSAEAIRALRLKYLGTRAPADKVALETAMQQLKAQRAG